MSEFHFKRFTVRNEKSAMKVNTDGVMLGAAVTVPFPGSRLLDIGTGTGTIALILAQRLEGECSIDAVEIDDDSASEAAANFAASPWPDSVAVKHCALQDFVPDVKYDLIVSNPPYYDESLRNPDERKSVARHTGSLSYREVLEFAAANLGENGRVAMVLPSDCERALLRYARYCSLFPSRLMYIRTTARKAPSRFIAEFVRDRQSVPSIDEHVIMDKGQHTSQHIALLGLFLTKF